MTTITRKQLVDAVEAGIGGIYSGLGFTSEAATALREVAATTTRVGRGEYQPRTQDGTIVDCPIAQAFPGDWGRLSWDYGFVRAYDDATKAIPGVGEYDEILDVVDEPQSV